MEPYRGYYEPQYRKTSLQDKPYVIIGLAVFLVLVTFVLEQIGNTENSQFMLEHGAAYWERILNGEYYRLFTAMFLHFGVQHLVNNVAMMLIIGCQLELMIGHVKTGIIFVATGLVGNICSVLFYSMTGELAVCAGASGAIYGLMGALCVALAARGRFDQNNLPARIMILVILVVYGSVSQPQVDVIAHVGGLVAGFVIAGIFAFFQKRPGRQSGEW